MMGINQRFTLLFIFLTQTIITYEIKRSHTFMKSHQADRHIFLHHINKGIVQGSCLSITGFYFEGLKHEKTAKPFLINHKETLLIQGDDVTHNVNRDVRAEWLGLPSTFDGQFSLRPTAKQGGLIVEAEQSLFKLTGFTIFKKSRICIRVPVMYVKHSLNMQGNQEVIQALNNPEWQNLLFAPTQKKWGIGDITLYTKNCFSRDYVTLNYYSGFIIPTGAKYNNENFFPIQFGNNRRLGLNGGLDLQIHLNKQPSCFKSIFFVNIDACYLLRTFRTRTFNLKEKPWSCFMQFNSAQDPQKINIPGVNVLSYEAHIKPNSMADFVVGYTIGNEYISCAFGYNVWGYEGEHIEHITDCSSENFGIASGITSNTPTSASQSTISKQSQPDETFTPIKRVDIDLKSGAHPSVLNHAIFFTTKGCIKTDSFETIIKIGLVGEFPQKNGICPLWGAWSSIIVSI